ncbi:GNAT family N-acetyltransferase [soil metagenome]
MVIRPATPADIPTILRFIRELAEYERALDQVVATEASLRRNLFPAGVEGRAGARPVAEALIGEVEGVAQGFAIFFMNFSTWVAEAGIYLEDLYVTPAGRGGGLGKALLAELARIALARGCQRVDWSVLDWNHSAHAFYTRLGAAPQSEWTLWRLKGEAIKSLADS